MAKLSTIGSVTGVRYCSGMPNTNTNPIPELNDPEWLRFHYLELGETTQTIADILGTRSNLVSYYLRRHAIPTRPRFHRGPLAERVCQECGARYQPTGLAAKFCAPCGETKRREASHRALGIQHERQKRERRTDRLCANCGDSFRGLESEDFCAQLPCREVAATTKRCWQCKRLLSRDHFHADRSRSDGLDARCHDCRYSQQRRDGTKSEQDKERKRVRDAVHRSRLRQKGIEPATYDAMLVAQGGSCAICKTAPEEGSRLVLDHDHRCCPTNSGCPKCIRGLLCRPCNLVIGNAQDDIDRLRAAIAYLESFTPQEDRP